MKNIKILAIILLSFLGFQTVSADYIETANDSVTVTVTAPVTYSISVSTGSGCTSSGGGTVTQGGSFSVSIGSSTGYNISSLSVDGVAAGSWGSSITFSNVTANHSVSLGCTPINYLVSKSAGSGGTINLPNGLTNQLVPYGSNLTASIVANSGYYISSASGCGGSLSGTSYTTGTITSSCTISASFAQSVINCVGSWSDTAVCSVSCGGGVKQQVYTITTPASGGGTACPYSTGDLRWGSTSCNTQLCAANCSSPCGTISSGSSCTAYSASSVTYPSSCTSQTRTCSDGYLSGSYQYSSCIVNSTTPTVSTSAITSITQTTASGGGSVTSNGGSTVTDAGIVWHVNSNPTTSLYTGKISHLNWADYSAWSDFITGLVPNTTYYVRAYATNSVGTSYGTNISFTTGSVVAPTVTTGAITSITQISAVGTGNTVSNGGATVTQAGLVWHVNSNPTTSSYTGISYAGWAIGGPWTGNSLTGLASGTTYYVRAYATNSAGTSYGSNVTFTTDTPPNTAPNAPTISGSSAFYNNSLQSFAVTGTDPDGDTIRYGIDWNNDGVADDWTSPYVASGTTMFGSHAWASNGTFTLKALTQDLKGANSPWSALFTVTVSEPPVAASVASFSVDKNKIDPGQAVKLTWTSQNATSCTMTSSPDPSVSLASLGAFTTNNNISFKPLKTTIYSLVCNGPGGSSPTSQITVTVGKIKPKLNEF